MTLLSVEFRRKTITCLGSVTDNVLVVKIVAIDIGVSPRNYYDEFLFRNNVILLKKITKKAQQFNVPARKIKVWLDHRSKRLTKRKERIVFTIVIEPGLSRLLVPQLV